MATIEARLKELGVTLPAGAPPLANYVPVVRTGALLVVSGQLAFAADGTLDAAHEGKLGAGVSHEAAMAAARLCAINILGRVRDELGDLDRVVRCVRLGGFIAVTPDFAAIAPVMNGASDFMVEVFGAKGRHARSTIGVACLPLDCCVEVEALFEVA